MCCVKSSWTARMDPAHTQWQEHASVAFRAGIQASTGGFTWLCQTSARPLDTRQDTFPAASP